MSSSELKKIIDKVKNDTTLTPNSNNIITILVTTVTFLFRILKNSTKLLNLPLKLIPLHLLNRSNSKKFTLITLLIIGIGLTYIHIKNPLLSMNDNTFISIKKPNTNNVIKWLDSSSPLPPKTIKNSDLITSSILLDSPPSSITSQIFNSRKFTEFTSPTLHVHNPRALKSCLEKRVKGGSRGGGEYGVWVDKEFGVWKGRRVEVVKEERNEEEGE